VSELNVAIPVELRSGLSFLALRSAETCFLSSPVDLSITQRVTAYGIETLLLILRI
jgi:hypothetical protein